jgi:hypothetical protein
MTKTTFNVSHILGVIMLFNNALFYTREVQNGFHVTWCSCPLTVTRRVSVVVLKLLILLQHVSSPSIKWGCIVKSLVVCVVFVDHCLSRCFCCCCCFVSFNHCIDYPSSILLLFVPFHLAIVLSIILRCYYCLYLYI